MVVEWDLMGFNQLVGGFNHTQMIHGAGIFTGRTEGLPGTEWVLLKEAHFTAQSQYFMTLVYVWVVFFHVDFSEKSVGKWTLCGLHACRPFPVFHFFWNYTNPRWNPNMVNCSMGPRDLITYINPKGNPNRNMVNCSMGPVDLVTFINRKWTPKRNMAEVFHGARGFYNLYKP